jgi:hypothetical protein
MCFGQADAEVESRLAPPTSVVLRVVIRLKNGSNLDGRPLRADRCEFESAEISMPPSNPGHLRRTRCAVVRDREGAGSNPGLPTLRTIDSVSLVVGVQISQCGSQQRSGRLAHDLDGLLSR